MEEIAPESASSLDVGRERAFLRRVNWVFALILVGLGCSVVLLFNAPIQSCFLAPVAFGCGVAALILARRLRDDTLDEHQRKLALLLRRWGIWFAAIMLAGAIVLGVACLGAVRVVDLSQVSAANLRGLGQAICMYLSDTKSS